MRKILKTNSKINFIKKIVRAIKDKRATPRTGVHTLIKFFWNVLKSSA